MDSVVSEELIKSGLTGVNFFKREQTQSRFRGVEESLMPKVQKNLLQLSQELPQIDFNSEEPLRLEGAGPHVR